MKRDLPLVSIVTPVYNSELFLEETLQSVLNQTYDNWEHILVDDCSSDKTLEILNNLATIDKRIRVYQLEYNSGSGEARNYAIDKAAGEYIAFLDSDDIWPPDKLKKHIAFMIERNAIFSHTSYGYIDENGNKIKNTFHVSKNPVTYTDLLKRTEISCLTAIYHAKEIGKCYMTQHRRKQDYALWLKILNDGYVSHGLDEELAYYRQHPYSATSKKYKLVIKHYTFLRNTQNLSMFQSMYYTSFWLVNGFIKYYLK